MKRIVAVAVTAMASIGLASFAPVSSAAVVTSSTSSTVVVHPSNMQGWGFLQEGATGSGQMVFGPDPAPLGDGSAELTVDDTGRIILANAMELGTRFDELSALSYSTYSDDATLAPTLQMNVDYDLNDAATGWQGRVVFEPYQNGTVTPDLWQTWDALGGEFWASSTGAAASNGACPQADPCTMSELLAIHPNAGVHATLGAVILRAGGPWAGGFVGNTDALVVGVGSDTTTYDFEPDPLPVVSADSPSIAEGNSGTRQLAFEVSLDSASLATVTVDFATASGSATSGSDFSPVSGTLTFAPGDTSETVSVPIIGDKVAELDESFALELSNPSNATLGTDGTGTIINDDVVKLKVLDVSVVEGDSGVRNITFKVTASQKVPSDTTFDYETNDGTAVTPDDYTDKSGTGTILAGKKVAVITVKVKGDAVAEAIETFTFDISNPSGSTTIQDGSGSGTIHDND